MNAWQLQQALRGIAVVRGLTVMLVDVSVAAPAPGAPGKLLEQGRGVTSSGSRSVFLLAR